MTEEQKSYGNQGKKKSGPTPKGGETISKII